ncbi:cytochrome c-type biogenesis CcmF C-terminal domain-containing protein [Psychrobacter submarinus]|uniref:cytochrome c-type biogenesis CcmF C-terminal domain-containing protein n=1 Tax=Psychrobacter submarinus TaxID=154108 RepID=UPI001D0F6BEE|nr:cytochrome c-type biogenesis CcmF C-terminal domain-containing protein [Psychrobacter submarinus]
MERHQSWIYLAFILAGLAVGIALPDTASRLEAGLWPLLGVLLYATFTQVPLTHIGRGLRDWRFLAALVLGNFVITPLLLDALVALLPLSPAVQAGVLLVLLVPCTDWFISFTHLGKGDAGRAIAATPVLLVVQMLMLPVYLWLFLGGAWFQTVVTSQLVSAFVGLILVPLALAWCTEYFAERSVAARRWVSSLVLAAVITYFVSPSAMLNIGVTLAVSFWVLFWMVVDFKDKTKNAPSFLQGLNKLRLSYWGQQTAHIGVIVAVIGVAFTSTLSIERDVALSVGETVHVQGYDFEVTEFFEIKGSNFDATQAQVVVSKDGREVAKLTPEKRTYIISTMPTTEAAIDPSLMRDVYVALGEPIADGSNQWALRIYVKPLIRWIWLGAIIMALGGLLSMLDRRYRLKTSKTPAQIAASKSGFTTVTDLDVKSTTNNTTLIGEKQND